MKGSVAHGHPALLPSSDLLDGSHQLLDVILGQALVHGVGDGAEARPTAGPSPVPQTRALHQAQVPLSQPAVPAALG